LDAAEELPAELGPWRSVPAGELAALLALRGQLVDMQPLMADHSSQAAHGAQIISSLD
jgi:hypothetical protein